MDIGKVLARIRPSANWSVNNNRYDSLEWFDETEKPTYQEIVDAWETISVEIENDKIEKLRIKAYQLESDPLFFKYQRGEAEKQEWLDKVEEIKERYPYTASSQE